MGYLFQAIDNLDIFNIVEAKLKDHFLSSAPIHGVKICSRMYEYLITHTPSALGKTLGYLLDFPSTTDDDLENMDASSDAGKKKPKKRGDRLSEVSDEKLAFRLRLAAGAVRAAGGSQVVANLASLEHFLTPTFAFSEDKAVRKAVCKLTKVILLVHVVFLFILVL